jgi:hypothetical protein
MVKAALTWVLRQLEAGCRTIPCRSIEVDLGELFRTDASATADRVVIGGWESRGGAAVGDCRWFSAQLTAATCPWLFVKGDGKLTIAASELLSTLVAVVLFTEEGPLSRGLVKLRGGTDNKGNSYIVQKLLTTKWPGAAVLMQLSETLMKRRLWLDLQWVPREQNVEADQLTNLDFTGFCPEKRMAVNLSALAFPLLHELLDEEASFRNELTARKREKAQDYHGPSPLHKKRKVKAPW